MVLMISQILAAVPHVVIGATSAHLKPLAAGMECVLGSIRSHANWITEMALRFW